jgi:hypothetical protein
MKITQVLTAILLSFILTFAYAQRGCCSYHGGVAGCDANTGYDLCNDGTDSPSCTCGNSSSSIY